MASGTSDRERLESRAPAAGAVTALALLLAVTLASAGARAQSQAPEESADPAAAEKTVEQLEADTEAAEALRAGAGAGRDVTYAEVLADPDDIALNFAFARTQVRQGQLKGAAATLERILLLEPRLAEVRLFYAFVLMRLDSLDAAERELESLRDLPMTPALRRQIDDRLTEIERRRNRLSMEALAGFGTHYDWNRNSVPSDRVLLFANVPATLDDDSAREDDVGFIGFGRVALRHDMGTQAKDEFIASATYYQDDQVTLDNLDLQSMAVDAGLALKYPDMVVTPTFFYNAIQLSREGYLRSFGLDAEVARRLDAENRLTLGARYTTEKYRPISESSTQVALSGWRFAVRGGWQHRLSETERLLLSARHLWKFAHVTAEEYRDFEAEAAYVRLLGDGMFLRPSMAVGQRIDRVPDTTVAVRTRTDRRLRLRLTAGAPLGSLLPMEDVPAPVAGVLSDAVLTATGTALFQHSKVRNYRYDNRRAELMLTRRWRF